MKPVSQRIACSVMDRLKPPDMKWHYEYGLVLQSIFLLGLKTGDDKFCDYVKSMYDSVIGSEGEILTYNINEFNLDQINPGKNLYLLHKKYGDSKYLPAIERLRDQLRYHPRTKTGGFWHKKIYPEQMWLDGLYMQAPFYAKYASKKNSKNDFNDILHQFSLIESKIRDKQTGLMYHAWDESRQQKWANPDTGCSPHIWGRAMGWYCMALVDTMEIIKSDTLEAIARSLIAPLLSYQDFKTGLWYQIMDKGNEEKNYTESSASSMFVYFLFKMLGLHIFSQSYTDDIEAAAVKAYRGLLEYKLKEDSSGELHLTDICKVAGLGGNPYRDGSYEYYVNEPVVSDDFKGLGPFILASMEYEDNKNEK